MKIVRGIKVAQREDKEEETQIKVQVIATPPHSAPMLENLKSSNKTDTYKHLIRYDDGIITRMQEQQPDQMGSNLIEHENACLATLS